MNALIVFESMWGNNQTIAHAIADGLRPLLEVEVIEVGHAPTRIPDGVDLLVTGGPTHAFGLSRPRTRESAATNAPGGLVSQGIGLREWLEALEPAPGHTVAAAYDTASKKPRWVGVFIDRAARTIRKRLRARGFRVLSSSERFHVTGTPSVLLEGEVERARHWGAELAETVTGQSRAA